MAGADQLRTVVDSLPAVDHHAHLLASPDAGIELADVLTESTDPTQVAQVVEHPAFTRACRDLTAFSGSGRDDHGEARGRRLLAACGFEAMYVDDGYRFQGALSLAEHAARVGCPVRRIIRLEAVAEAAAGEWPTFESCREGFRTAIEDGVAGGAVALKTIAAYRAGLDLPQPDVGEAKAAYHRWRRSGDDRLSEPALVSFFLFEALDVTRGGPIPLQVHTGVGDNDLRLHRADPSLLQPLIEDARCARVPIVLLHCYPFVAQASYLAGTYANVYLDLSLAVTLVTHRGADLVLHALDLAPATKLLFATDASRLPEAFFLSTRWWRDSLISGLGRLVDALVVNEATAARWAELVLAGNARRVYSS